ncbi:MAG: ParD-like family protein [Kangiellaceae bacterium]|nr:ParD-like family protein [Kangiellaceae bacterium]
MGILKISEELHEEIRKASNVMSRSINAQAEFWIKMGMYAESNPDRSFNELITLLLQQEEVIAASAFREKIEPNKSEKNKLRASACG